MVRIVGGFLFILVVLLAHPWWPVASTDSGMIYFSALAIVLVVWRIALCYSVSRVVPSRPLADWR